MDDYNTDLLAEAKNEYMSRLVTILCPLIIEGVKSNSPLIRHELAKRTRNQLRRMPELLFFGDDSLDYIEEIDKSLRGEDLNPIEDPSILPKRKKQ